MKVKRKVKTKVKAKVKTNIKTKDKINSNKLKINNKLRNLIIFMIIISLIEIFLAGMLTAAKYNDTIASICGENTLSGCNVVQNSDFANLINVKKANGTNFKIPVAFVGTLFYLIFTFFLFKLYNKIKFGSICKNNSKKIKSSKIYNFVNNNIEKIILGFGFMAFLVSLIYTLIQAFIIGSYCKFCLTSAFNSTVLFLLILYFYFYMRNK